jgi:hypothetical protein
LPGSQKFDVAGWDEYNQVCAVFESFDPGKTVRSGRTKQIGVQKVPIFKFKSLFEAERALWNFKPDEMYVRRVAELWNFANQLSDVKYPRGVFKFRSITEANRHRDELELKRAREIVNQSSKSS